MLPAGAAVGASSPSRAWQGPLAPRSYRYEPGRTVDLCMGASSAKAGLDFLGHDLW